MTPLTPVRALPFATALLLVLHPMALSARDNGAIVGWGSQVVVRASLQQELVSLSAGGGHSMGLRADGTLVVWGDNREGQCQLTSATPGCIAVSAGLNHSLALLADGSLRASGDNLYGQCELPTPGSPPVAISAGYFHNLALLADGSLCAWGDN
ncbi:MAG: hypothetical protein KC488_02045, partial [Candidatus Cloacimonetes bacterium]|nr:hypothetical protein [Candidatus Cloacimonadota bacterium]